MYQYTLDDIMIDLHPWNYMRAMFQPMPLMITEDAHKTARIVAFEERKQNRIDGLYAAATRRNTEANRRINAGFRKLDAIPFGQPVHGDRDRNYRRKAGNMIDKGYALSMEADKIESRARAAERYSAISSDDPMGIEKLTAKLDKRVKLQERMKAANSAIRMKNTEAGNKKLSALGYSDEDIKNLRKGDFCGRVGYPAYALQNNNAEIRRIKSRIEELEAKQDEEPETWTGEGWTAETDQDDNRIRVYFDGKPDEKTRAILKGYGFRWSPRNQAWQRQDTIAGRSAMRMLKQKLDTL